MSEKSGPEAALMLDLIKKQIFSPLAPDKVKVSANLDWERFLSQCRFHEVGGVVYQALTNLKITSPQTIYEEFQRAYYRSTLKASFLTREMTRIIETLFEEGIQVIPFKGPITKALCYGPNDFRYFSDLDFLIWARDLPEIRRILELAGFTSPIEDDLQLASYIRRNCELAFSYEYPNSGTQLHLEFHWQIIHEVYGINYGMESLFKDPTTLTIGTKEVKVLGIEDNLIALTIHHGIKDKWLRLKPILDLAGFIENNPGINWASVMRLTQKHGLQTSFLSGICIAQMLFGLKTPQLDKWIRPKHTRIAKRIYRQLFRPGRAFKPEAIIIQLLLYDTMMQRLAFLVKRFKFMFYPQAEDIALIKLPYKYHFMYIFVKPFRLLTRLF